MNVAKISDTFDRIPRRVKENSFSWLLFTTNIILFETVPMKMNKIFKVTNQSAEMHGVVFMKDMCTSSFKDQEYPRWYYFQKHIQSIGYVTFRIIGNENL